MRALIFCLLAWPAWVAAQQHEVALTLGRVSSPARNLAAGTLDLKGGTVLQAVYGYRLLGGTAAALYANAGFVSVPLRDIRAVIPASTRDFATLYVTPALTVKFRPGARVSPWITGGAGYALYEQSRERTDGQPNGAPRLIHRGQVMFGGGADVKFLRWLALRGEIRDFYTGSPAFNLPQSGGQHNVAVSGGVVVRFGD